jgi:Domain of unknown function (DUF5063)
MGDNNELMQRFRATALKFIEVVDAGPLTGANTFLANVGRSLAELYTIALSLPAVESHTTGTDATPFQTGRWNALRLSLQEKIGSLDAYWQVFDSSRKEEPVQGSLSGDISEIYFDLKRSLELEQTDASRSDVLFDWRMDFRSHWGRHLLGALAAIHNQNVE